MKNWKLIFDAMAPLSAEFFDVARCNEWLAEKLHPDGYRCPSCGNAVGKRSRGQFVSGRKVLCHSCKKQFNIRTGTVVQGSHFSSAEIFLLSLLNGQGYSLHGMTSKLKRDRETVYNTLQRLAQQ